MIADIDSVDRDLAIRSIARLEAELFGRGAWSETVVAQELAAPGRTYVVDVGADADAGPDMGAGVDLDCAEGGAQDSAGDGAGARGGDGMGAQDNSDAGADDTGVATIRGYAGFWYDGDDAELMTIGVGRAYQRQGIAAALMNNLIGRARQCDAARMLLEVRVDNEPALALYRRFGFQRMGLRKRYYQPEGVDAYTMSLELRSRPVGFQTSNNTNGETL
jgi:ribosomal-protein-alanine N-acetyltransferase